MTTANVPIDTDTDTDTPTETGGTDRELPSCGACPHRLDHHDALGRRFCAATAAGSFDRGCICR